MLVPMDVDRPQDLGDGLVLRRATPDDVDGIVAVEVAAFGASDEPGVRAGLVGPGATVADWTVVTDSGGAVVAASALLDHELEVDGATMPVAQIEYVATDPAHQRRGLVRQQFAWHHADRLAEMEVNPLVVLPKGQGVMALDAVIACSGSVA